MAHERQHDVFQFAFAHLPVADQDPRLRHQLADLLRDLVNALHAVVHEVHLAAAFQFLLDGALDQLLVPLRDHRLDRHAILRRRLDHAHIAQSQQRHVQRARNRRRRHGEHVHFFAQLLQPLFVAHAEALLFVDDHQPEVGELDVLREDAVGADQDVDLSVVHLLDDFFLLLRRAEAGDHLDLYRETRRSVA